MNYDIPYLSIVGMPREMGGSGAPKPTVFGVLGHTREDGLTRSLGGLVIKTTGAKALPVNMYTGSKNSEKHLIGPASKTHISGAHYGQVPYAGRYMAHVGAPVS